MKTSYFRKLCLTAALAVSAFSTARAKAASIAAGDLTVVQVGTGAAALAATATQSYINEYTTAGTAVQQITLPTGTGGLTLSGTATSEGFITESSDGAYLTLGGYSAALGATVTSATSTAVPRVIGYVNLGTGAVDTTTALSTGGAFSGSNIRSAYSTNGTSAYATGGATGIVYAPKGATSGTIVSTTSTNTRVINGFGGNLFFSTGAGTRGIYQISGTPTTTGNTASLLFGTGASSSPYDFAFASSSVVYIADDSTVATGGGIQKWVLGGSGWTKAYTITGGSTSGDRGLALSVGSDGDTVTIYATTAATSANSLVSITDSLIASSLTASNYNVLATAATNTVFRGVEFVAPTPEPTSLTALAFGGIVLLKRRRVAR